MGERLSYLDGLRGVAILLVLAGHTGSYTFCRDRVGELGGLGVLLFFVLSGYLITRLLLRERAAHGAIDLRAFYARRALRILPAFWTLMAVTGVLRLAGVVNDVSPGGFTVILLFVRNWVGRGQTLSHVWTLSLEEQFYALWPAALPVIDERRALGAAAALALACVAGRGYAVAARLYPWESDVFYLRTDFRMDSLLAGCCVARAERGRAGERLTALARRAPLAFTAPVLLAWALGASGAPALRPVFLTTETLLAVLVFGGVLADGATPATRALQHSALVWLGRLSYSVYLWQQLFLVRSRATGESARLLPLALVGSAGAALLSYAIVARPALPRKARWARVPALGMR